MPGPSRLEPLKEGAFPCDWPSPVLVRAITGGTGRPDYRCAEMNDDPLKNMRERIERCRRLAEYVNDPRTTEALLQMAEQGEADLARLLEERARRDNR